MTGWTCAFPCQAGEKSRWIPRSHPCGGACRSDNGTELQVDDQNSVVSVNLKLRGSPQDPEPVAADR